MVVHHDADLGGEPPAYLAGYAIRTVTSEELHAFRVRGQAIPTLGEVLEAVGDRMVVYCELKGAGTAEPAVRILTEERRRVTASPWRAAVHSFDHRMVAEARRLAPGLPRGVLETSYHVDPAWALASVDARDLWQHWELIDRPMVEAVHARAGRVVAWTANDPTLMARLLAMGVDALCTDDVATARRVLGR